jgi:hypothetical protein
MEICHSNTGTPEPLYAIDKIIAQSAERESENPYDPFTFFLAGRAANKRAEILHLSSLIQERSSLAYGEQREIDKRARALREECPSLHDRIPLLGDFPAHSQDVYRRFDQSQKQLAELERHKHDSRRNEWRDNLPLNQALLLGRLNEKGQMERAKLFMGDYHGAA